jgi:predicted ATP-grasp superfamily ATP-dependent carboligase
MAAGAASLCGVTRQWVGESWTHAAPFAYCGSIGPVELPDSTLAQFIAIGQCLAAEFNLTGLIGIDTIISNDRVFVIEVNPRYTASVEVLERALNRSLLGEHIVACRERRLPKFDATGRSTCCGKAILFSPTAITIRPPFSEFTDAINQSTTWPPLADIPRVGTETAQGHPVITARVEDETPTGVETRLRQLLATLEGKLQEHCLAADSDRDGAILGGRLQMPKIV